jgi:hypothetical protein
MTPKPKRSKTARRLRLKKIPVLAYLEPEQAEALKELSKRLKQPQQFFIRQGVEWALDRYSRGVFPLFIEQRRLAKMK